MRILLLSAYEAVSHRHWRESLLEMFPEYEWTCLTLPPRYFNWRIRGNSLTWAYKKRATLEQSYDLLIATSMVDLSALRGLVPSIATIPTLVYFHENQFEYPKREQQFSSIEPQILNLYTALSADVLAFNSEYNRDTFLSGVKALLKKMPDEIPKGIDQLLESKSSVLPVAIHSGYFVQRSGPEDKEQPLHLLWNHRWEYDKAPERFLAAVKDCLQLGVKLEISVVGQQFRDSPPEFETTRSYLANNYSSAVKHWGFIEKSEAYRRLLVEADVVVSSAIHDFQGLAVLEAVASGCVPLVPNRLCYGEWFADSYRYESHLVETAMEVEVMANAIKQLVQAKANGQIPVSPDIGFLSISNLKPKYQAIFQQVCDQHSL